MHVWFLPPKNLLMLEKTLLELYIFYRSQNVTEYMRCVHLQLVKGEADGEVC